MRKLCVAMVKFWTPDKSQMIISLSGLCIPSARLNLDQITVASRGENLDR